MIAKLRNVFCCILRLKQAVWLPGSADTVCPRSSVTLTFDLLILKLLCESHLSLGTLISNLVTLVLWVLELFAMCATDRQTDRRTKATLIASLPTVGGIITYLAIIFRLYFMYLKWQYRDDLSLALTSLVIVSRE